MKITVCVNAKKTVLGGSNHAMLCLYTFNTCIPRGTGIVFGCFFVFFCVFFYKSFISELTQRLALVFRSYRMMGNYNVCIFLELLLKTFHLLFNV